MNNFEKPKKEDRKEEKDEFLGHVETPDDEFLGYVEGLDPTMPPPAPRTWTEEEKNEILRLYYEGSKREKEFKDTKIGIRVGTQPGDKTFDWDMEKQPKFIFHLDNSSNSAMIEFIGKDEKGEFVLRQEYLPDVLTLRQLNKDYGGKLFHRLGYTDYEVSIHRPNARNIDKDGNWGYDVVFEAREIFKGTKLKIQIGKKKYDWDITENPVFRLDIYSSNSMKIYGEAKEGKRLLWEDAFLFHVDHSDEGEDTLDFVKDYEILFTKKPHGFKEGVPERLNIILTAKKLDK